VKAEYDEATANYSRTIIEISTLENEINALSVKIHETNAGNWQLEKLVLSLEKKSSRHKNLC